MGPSRFLEVVFLSGGDTHNKDRTMSRGCSQLLVRVSRAWPLSLRLFHRGTVGAVVLLGLRGL